MIGVYKFNVDCGRMGDIDGVFTASGNDIAKLIGHVVCFGEILGKHSDVHFEIEDDMFTLVTNDEEFINRFDTYNLETGINPLNYVDLDELEELYDPENDKIEKDDL